MKLKFREKLNFLWENKLWLEEVNSYLESEYGIAFYNARDLKTFLDSYWVAEKINGKTKLTKISKLRGIRTHRESYNSDEAGVYLSGDKGLFYKKVDQPLKEVFVKRGYERPIFFKNLGIIVILMEDGEGCIAQIKSEELTIILQNKKIVDINGSYPNYYNWESYEENVKIIVEEGVNTYSYYYIANDGSIQHENISMDNYKEFLNHLPVKAIDESGKELLVALGEEHQIEKYEKDGVLQIQELSNEEYYAVHEIEKVSIIRYKKGFNLIGTAPCGEYTLLAEIDNTLLYKVKNEKGITVIAISDNGVKEKEYPNTIELKLAAPKFLTEEGVISYKLIATYEEEVS